MAPGHGRRRPAAPRRGSGVGGQETRGTTLAAGRWRRVGGRRRAALLSPVGLLKTALVIAALGVLYVGVVVCLRATGLLVTDHSIPPLHKRQVFGVFAAMVVACLLTAFVAVQLVVAEHRRTAGEPEQPGLQRLHRAVRAAAQPDRVAGQPQRHVVGCVQLPRLRAHHHHPRAAQRRRPLPHDRRVLRLRRQGSRAHEPGRGREP